MRLRITNGTRKVVHTHIFQFIDTYIHVCNTVASMCIYIYIYYVYYMYSITVTCFLQLL